MLNFKYAFQAPNNPTWLVAAILDTAALKLPVIAELYGQVQSPQPGQEQCGSILSQDSGSSKSGHRIHFLLKGSAKPITLSRERPSRKNMADIIWLPFPEEKALIF